MPRSIRSRIVLSHMLLTLLTVAMIGWLGLLLLHSHGTRREQRYLEANAESIARQVEPYLAIHAGQRQVEELARTSAFLIDARVRVLDEAGALVTDSGAGASSEDFIWVGPPGGAIFVRRMGSHLDGRIEFHQERVYRSRGDGAGPAELRVEILSEAEGPRDRAVPLGAFQAGEAAATDAGDPVTAASARRVSRELDGPRPHRFDTILHPSPQTLRLPIGEASAPLGFVEVSQGPSFQSETLGAAARAFGIAALVASLFAAIVGLVFSRGMTAPLARLKEATDRMGAGDLAARAPVAGRDEIASLAGQFNRMAEQLESSFAALQAERDALRHFIADASHELRTPITALKNFNSLLQGPAALDEDARREFLEEGSRQIERLEWMTGHLLDLSRLEAGLIALEAEPHSVEALVGAALAPILNEFEAKGMSVDRSGLDPALELLCDGERMQMVLNNLAQNALKYGRPEGCLKIAAAIGDDGLPRIVVEDDGRGVPETERERVFERFYRGSNAGAEAGDGLGLAIARSVVRAHGGELRCEARAGDEAGSRFVIEMRRREAPGDSLSGS